ncbi:MAG: PRC and DUF2382 domain-containing protein [Actinomycetota bacterium]|nr:PRC and DUF2382 domain-containing protein [Actinomycetota bacterium]MDQ5810649.1 PRC and DUF2382 domain-containing protein [Actinomycetota bacterium]MDQ5817621.1 PRC and DUF2382 domain-containing protein [Actinomycetota bacterium]
MAQENLGKRFDGYQIYDRHYEKVGKVDDLFVDENDVPEYIGVKTSLFGGPSTLIPMDIVRVNDLRQLVEVASDKATIENAPSFGDDAEITAEFEERVYAHFGATRESPLAGRGGYGAYHDENADVDVAYGERSRTPESGSTAPATSVGYEYPVGEREAAGPPNPTGEERGYAEAEPREGARVYDWDIETERRGADRGHSGAGTVGSGMSMGDTETGEFREHDRNQEGLSQPGSDLEDEDELRVQRSEEELLAGTRERVAGSVNVRKRVRTDRERLEVPTRREEVSVERVPASGEASEAQIGADEVSVPVVEDEVVVQKKPVVKEEIRLRKDVVHERQIVEEDVRREEVEIEDDTRHRRG